MKIVAWLFAVLLSALAAAGGGYWRGHADGKAADLAAQDHKEVAALGALLQSHADLARQANAASAGLRAQLAARQASDRQFSREFRNALKQSEADRADCRFGADIVQRLGAARERAAQAAAGGGAATVPAASGGAGR